PTTVTHMSTPHYSVAINLSNWNQQTCLFILSHFFFFKGTAHPRDLHSFPTRRSSDLTALNAPSSATSGQALSISWTALNQGPSRSEEHTSELQSLRHLVCRLLLEKKKNTNNNTYLKYIIKPQIQHNT